MFFFNDTATTEIYTLSLHDALPICQERRQDQAGLDGLAQPDVVGDEPARRPGLEGLPADPQLVRQQLDARHRDRKSTRLNSSHANIPYAVFCLKKKRQITAFSHPRQ